MNLILVISAFCGPILVQSADIPALSGDCGSFDSCSTGDQLLRTCSCDLNCANYGTCCRDSEYARKMAAPDKAEFRCNSDRTITPVYAKRACLPNPNRNVHQPGHQILCEEEQHDDKADVMGNVLVTSRKTKITYWNKDCGLCNNENLEDLVRWTIQVTCPSKHGDQIFTKNYVENHLFFDKDMEEWGLKVEDGFRTCSLTFAEPKRFKGQLPYCAPNLIAGCPKNYPKKGVAETCHAYHAERKHKGMDNEYYKNVHCAQCNGVEEEDLECVGRDYEPVGVEGGRDYVKLSFDQEWLDKEGMEKYKCSWNNTWDPFHLRCRKYPMDLWKQLPPRYQTASYSQKATFHSYLLIFIVLINAIILY